MLNGPRVNFPSYSSRGFWGKEFNPSDHSVRRLDNTVNSSNFPEASRLLVVDVHDNVIDFQIWLSFSPFLSRSELWDDLLVEPLPDVLLNFVLVVQPLVVVLSEVLSHVRRKDDVTWLRQKKVIWSDDLRLRSPRVDLVLNRTIVDQHGDLVAGRLELSLTHISEPTRPY